MTMWGAPPRTIRDEAFVADDPGTATIPLVRSTAVCLTINGHHRLNVNLTGRLVMPTRSVFSTVAAIASATDSFTFPGPGFMLDSNGLSVNADGIVHVPGDPALRQRIMIVSHQVFGGHRAVPATHVALSAHFTWDTLLDDLKVFISGCLHCVKSASGQIVPRPMGSQLRGTRPGEVITIDFMKMPHGYICLMKCTFTQKVMSSASSTCAALDAVVLLMAWFAQNGLLTWLVSGGGAHFVNTIVEMLAHELMFDHRICVAHSPGRLAASSAPIARTSAASATSFPNLLSLTRSGAAITGPLTWS